VKLVVGIGNPGSEYEGTRHNVGFEVIDLLARADDIDVRRRRFDALVGDGQVASTRVLLMKPQTYVNVSGRAVRAALDWLKLTPDELLVICDDVHLPLGKLRFRRGGSSGGHNGLASVIEHLGTEGWSRLRIGIGPERGDRVDHVLGRFSASERKVIDEAEIDAARGVGTWLREGIDACMNAYNG
jgi:PTH1 family peptidyl-tRNA hydrolase